MAPHRQLEEVLYLEALACRADAGETVPERLGGHLYFARTSEAAGMPTFLRVNAATGREETVLDPEAASRGERAASFGSLAISPDHSRAAFIMDTEGGEGGAVCVQRIGAGGGAVAEECGIARGATAVQWSRAGGRDRPLLYYTSLDDAGSRPAAVLRRAVGAPASAAEVVFWDGDPSRFVDVKGTKSGRFLTLNANDRASSEVRVVDAEDATAAPRLVRPREAGVEYYVEHAGGRFVIVTNARSAGGSFGVAVAEGVDALCEPSRWRQLVAPSAERSVEDVDVFDWGVALYERVATAPRLRLVHLCGGREIVVPVPLAAAVVSPGANADPAARRVRLTASSPLVPELTLEVDADSGAVRELRRVGVPDFDASAFTAGVEWAEADDGAPVPLTVVRPARAAGPRPALLRGYGAYGLSLETPYSPADVALLRRGWILAFAHVRGGGELGRAWYRAGRLEHKERSFADFAACAAHLCARGYSRRGLVAAQGHSAGGLLVAAAAMRDPGAFGAVVLRAPFVDVANTMADPSLALTVHEYDEWGDVRGREAAERVAAYCPTQRLARGDVAASRLPPTLVRVGGSDTRVEPWAQMHFVARWRAREHAEAAAAAVASPLLCEFEEERGHFGWGGRERRYAEDAREQAFLLGVAGLRGGDGAAAGADPVEESRRLLRRGRRASARRGRPSLLASLRQSLGGASGPTS